MIGGGPASGAYEDRQASDVTRVIIAQTDRLGRCATAGGRARVRSRASAVGSTVVRNNVYGCVRRCAVWLDLKPLLTGGACGLRRGVVL